MSSWQSRLIRLYLNYLKATTNWDAPLPKLRRDADNGARLSKYPAAVKAQRISVEHIPAEWLIPMQVDQNSAMLYLHGGGYATSSIKSHRSHAARMAEAGNIRTLIIDYRLAPEHPFPAAIEDAVLACDWLRENGCDHIILAGDSAGGGLALATVLALRDQQKPMPVKIVCLSPLIDVEGTGASVKTNAKRDPWLKEDAKHIFRYYVVENDPRNPLISPLYADFSGFPPILIHAGGDELMLSDATRLAEKAGRAGVAVQIKIWPRMWHVFPFFAPFVPEASQALAEIGDFIQS